MRRRLSVAFLRVQICWVDWWLLVAQASLTRAANRVADHRISLRRLKAELAKVDSPRQALRSVLSHRIPPL